MRARGPVRDAAGLDDVAEEVEVGEVEVHAQAFVRQTFVLREGRLHEILIVHQFFAAHIRLRRSTKAARGVRRTP
jgi:hypothetical protein